MIKSIPLDRIQANPWQTRIADPSPDYIKGLALDIAKNGLLQVPIGRSLSPIGEWDVQLAFGHNRLAAFKWLADVKDNSDLTGDYTSMPVDIRDLTDEWMANLAWSENEKRRDVTPIERAKAIQKRLDDFGWNNRKAAEALGIDHSTISNILRLLKLPESLQIALQDGSMTERQATAILVLFELPEFKENFWPSKDDIIRDALNGLSSDQLRERVDRYLNGNGKKLEDADFKVSQLISEGGPVYCGTCDTCDKRFKNRNLCFVHTCYEAKQKFVHLKYLGEASFISGYPILDQEKGGVPTQIMPYQLDALKATKCQNLVIQYCRNKSQDVPGFPHAFLICEKRNNSCSCMAGLRANDRSGAGAAKAGESAGEPEEIEQVNPPVQATPSARDLEETARQMRKEKKEAIDRRSEILRLVEERLVQALKEDAVGVFYLIAHSSTYIWSNTELDLEECYQEIARKFASYPLVPSQSDNLADLIENINDGLARLQLEPISLAKSLVQVFDNDVCAQTDVEEAVL